MGTDDTYNTPMTQNVLEPLHTVGPRAKAQITRVINDPVTIHSSMRGSNPSRYRFARISFPRHAQHIVRQKITHSKGINEAKLESCLLFTHVMSATALSATKNLLIVRQKRKTQQQKNASETVFEENRRGTRLSKCY